MASEKLLKRLDPRPSKGTFWQLIGQDQFRTFPKLLSTATKTDTKKGTRLGEAERNIVNGFIRGGSLDLNGDRPIEPHPTSNDGIYRSPALGEVRGTACLGVMEVIDYPLAP